ncbi:MAG: hypothetical protein KGI75_04155 [Rhizobiaceae bacterium]|nr:hypothetical protein [Rhizobiaceae bacterium]
MSTKQAIVEAAIETQLERLPIGLMSAKQALELPDAEGVIFSHPDEEAGTTNTYVSQAELGSILEPE